MGAKDSKISTILYEDAIKRITDTEYRRLKEAFKRSAGVNGTLLSKNAFVQDVLCEGVPSLVADWLYQACGGTSKGIGLKELICALVLLTKGTQDEKIRFLWTLYSNDSCTLIQKNDFYKALQIEATYQSNSSLPPGATLSRSSNNNQQINFNYVSLFGSSSSVNFDQFRSWILMHKNETVLSKWLLVESCVNLSSDLETPTFYQSLAGVTHLEEQDIGDLEKVFWYLKSCSLTNQLDIESLGPLISPPVPKAALSGIFLAFDENRDGHIDFKELCCGVSAACRGPDVERSKFCFKIFDTDRDGSLCFTEVEQMVNNLLLVAKESNFNVYKNVTFNQTMLELYNYTTKNNKDVKSDEATNEKIKEFILTQEDYLMWCIESNSNISQPFLDLLFEVSHIVFGLRPQCKHHEYEIVRGWLSREVRRGYQVGQFWYLISSEWWQSWLCYTQFNNQSLCSNCKTSHNRHPLVGSGDSVDEAMVCDESFASNLAESTGDLIGTGDSSSLGSGSSGISVGKHSSPPGQIDNSILLAPNPYKTVQTLTGEGGRLKKDIPLVLHRDFELVPDSLWKALSQWYGGILALPRQVIKPPNVEDKELELYPLNLRILRHQQVQQNQGTSTHQITNTWNNISGGYGALSNASYSGVSSVSTTLQAQKKYLAYTAAFSRLATVKQVGEFLCQRLKLRSEDIRLWHVIASSSSAHELPYLLEEDNATLTDLCINDNDQILLEIRNKDLTWPQELESLTISQNNAIVQERRGTIASVQSMHAPGATGLHNLGNTCFMNSALQVLFNTQPLTQYFRQNMHLYEVNAVNKMGTKGQLVLRYAELLKDVWGASTRSIAPLKFRFCVTKHAPQFAGGGQHDSQELLDWLLDTLHEDLNRVTDKPYMELKDSNGRSDQIVAAESWDLHVKRNQSIIVDLFYGQLKSKVSCLTCGNESVRFDPFSLLSLPLPVENYTYCEVLVTLLDGSVPIKYGIRLNSDCKYWDLKHQIAPMCQLDPDRMLVCELAGSQIKCILPNEQKIKPNTAFELYIFELPKLDEFQRSRAGSELGTNIEKGLKDIQRNQALLLTSPEQHQMTTTSASSASSTEDGAAALNASKKPSETSKVRRCFGNSCMPPNLLCFKHSIDLMGTSPMSTFMDVTTGTYNHLKTISTTNLLSTSTNELRDTTTEIPANHIKPDNITNGCTNCSNGDSEEDDLSSITSSATKHCVNYDTKCGYLIAVHRKLSRQDTYFLSHHKTRPSLFGQPLLIPLYEGVKNKDLYCSVWIQVARLLSPLPPTPPDQSNHAADCDDSLGYDFPFTLRAVAENGRVCALCPWPRFCRGCQIPCNDEPLLHGIISSSCSSSNSSTPNLSSRESHSNTNSFSTKMNTVINSNSINIAIDWDPTALHLRYQSTREKMWTEHSSVAHCRKQQIEPVDLDHCLRAFTSEEKLDEWYYCSHCKSKQPATKKLQLWKLPPILIVHLKRFNFVNTKWVKSQKVVNFPFKNFDPTPYLASVPQETILRHKDLLEQQQIYRSTAQATAFCDDEIQEFDMEMDMVEGASNNINNNNNNNSSYSNNNLNTTLTINQNHRVCEVIRENGETNDFDDEPIVEVTETNSTKINNQQVHMRTNPRKRLVSTSLTKTPVIDGEFIDYNNHQLKPNQDPFDLKYQLYAVVSHSGMLNGGHYVSYASNANGSWYCFNDSSCREIPQRQPQIDPSSAYLLFYERQNLDYLPYLPKMDGKPPANGHTIETDDNENDLRKMCVLS